MQSISRAALAAVLFGATAWAQEAPLSNYRAAFGEAWQTIVDPLSGETRLLFGSRGAASIQPRTSADYVRLARAHAGDASELLALDVDQLALDRELFLPLALVGTSDKVTVRFTQSVDQVPVRDGSLNVLMDVEGRLLSIFDKTVEIPADFSTTPELSQEEAIEFAWSTFERESEGLAASYVDPPVLEVVASGVRRDATLAWVIPVIVEENGIITGGYRYLVAAEAGEGRIVGREAIVHNFDVGGTVFTNATPGLGADTPGSVETQQRVKYATVSAPGVGTTTTDEDGQFNFPGVTGPIDVTVSFEGTYNDVNNANGAEHSITASISGTNNTLVMNPSPSEETTAEANTFQWINNLADWIQSVNPADTAASFTADANVNIPPGVIQGIDNCNAFWNGISTNYFLDGGSCRNTAFSTIVAHEMGHWLNARYGSGNGPDGFGEGNADVFAMFMTDSPVVGSGFFNSGGFIRTGTNSRQYCGDGNGGCYGAVHTDGQVLMGAFWKSRVALKNTNGNQLGGDIADALFLGWMNAFDQGQIDSIIQIQLLILDDDDGDSSNGTPHAADIVSGFAQQGFPGLGVEITGVTLLEDTLDESGPYVVRADLNPVFSGGILSAQLQRTVNGQATLPIPLQNLGGTEWGVAIPGTPSPALVSYTIQATNSLGQQTVWPGPGQAIPSFRIGQRESYFEEDFDGPTDAGWTHVEIATQDDWQRNAPQGKSGTSQGVSWTDPDAAVSGSNAWGNDLGPDGFNGAYQPNVVNFLESPAINLAGATGVQLSFQRWLTVEEAQYDQAQILVNGNLVWENPFSGQLLDTSWRLFTLDISAFADNNPATTIQFRLQTDGGLNLGGWNIDDLRLESLQASPTVCVPTAYGTGLAGASGVPELDTMGQPVRIGNPDFAFRVKRAGAGNTVLLGRGPTQLSVPIFGGTLLTDATVISTLVADEFGVAILELPLPEDSSLVGTTRYVQAFILDPVAPAGVSMTQGLEAIVCN